ncbi:MAG: hypothetical protein WCG01_05465 [bacterium]
MDQRSEKILSAILKEYLKTAQPVGSTVLVSKYKLGISSATVRNAMNELEENGYIVQPHTSSGRIPTALAYKSFLSDLTSVKIAAKPFVTQLSDDLELDFKNLAREVAESTGLSVFWAINKRNFFHTGISNLLTQPEFIQTNLIYNISAMIDAMELIIEKKFEAFSDGLQVLIGEDNPFSPLCSSLILKYKISGLSGLVGIIGPLRMNYESSLAVMKLIEEKIKYYDKR